MKLLKIGSSSSSDITLNSEYVSGHHAEIILLDSGEIILEDKNSTNGTFVGGKKITPNKEVTIQRGDYVKFADVELQWSHVPSLENTSKYKSIVNIGANFRNDLVVSGAFVSRFHATFKVLKDNKCNLVDLGSKNGTKVNGVRIQSGKEVRIKRGDIVICGDTDITEQIQPFFPQPWYAGWVKWTIGGVAAAVAIVLVFVLVSSREPCDVCGEKHCQYRGIHPPKDFRSAVVYVRACYHYIATLEDNPIPELWDGQFDNIESIQPYQATAFFIDREGRMATNRHVAIPWEYREKAEENRIKQRVKEGIENLILVKKIYTENDLSLFRKTDLGEMLFTYSLGSADNKTWNKVIPKLNTVIDRLRNSTIKISGEMDYITVGYPGRNYTHPDEFDRCFVLTESGSSDKDIALLQMNNKKTPVDVKYIFDVKKCYMGKLEPLKDRLYIIGYPNGLGWNLDNKTNSLEPFIRETFCSKEPSKYVFDLQGNSAGGASGSPIFNERGLLVGIHWGGYESTTFTKACQARYLKEMYEEEVGL